MASRKSFVSHLQNTSEVDITKYYHMIQEMCEIAAKQKNDVEEFDGEIHATDVEKKNGFISATDITSFSQVLIECLVLMEWNAQNKTPKMSQTAIYNSILRLEKAMLKSSFWELVDNEEEEDEEEKEKTEDNGGLLPEITNFELNMVERTMSSYIVDRLETKTEQVFFFPIKNPPEADALVTWRILEKIADVKIIPGRAIYKQKLKDCLKKRLKSEVEEWLEIRLKPIILDNYQTILNDVQEVTNFLADLMNELNSVMNSMNLVERLFTAVDCNYWDSTAEVLDSKLFSVCEQTMNLVDAYNMAHKEFHVNLRESSTLCHAFFVQVKEVVSIVNSKTQTFVAEKINSFSNLFTDAFLHLLHVVKVECHSRIERAVLSEDKDTILEEQCMTSSTVIVLNIMYTVLDEWKQLQIENEDMRITFLVKITEVLCDGCMIFCENMQQRALNSSANDKDQIILQMVSVLANSVEHLKEYMRNLPDTMKWRDVLESLTKEDGPDTTKLQVEHLLDSTFSPTLTRMDDVVLTMLYIIALSVRNQCEKFLNSWLKDQILRDPRLQNVEKFLAVLHDEIEIIHDCLKKEIFRKFLKTLWLSILNYFNDGFQDGKSPDYAKTLKKNIEDIHNYFTTLKTDESQETAQLYEQVLYRMAINSKTTVELQLDYYGQLADTLKSPEEYLGHLALQACYKTSGRGMVDITVKIQKARRIPVRKFEISDLWVKVEFCPDFIFPSLRQMESKCVSEELQNPTFDKTFHVCNIPLSALSVEGAVIHTLVVNQDSTFCAEVVLKLNLIHNMSGYSSIDFLPVYLMALKRPDRSLPPFQILEKRRKKDRRARRFVSRRIASENNSRSVFAACVAAANSTRSLLAPPVRRISNYF